MPRRRPVVEVSLIRVMPRINQEESSDFFPATMPALARAIDTAWRHKGTGHEPEAHVIRLAFEKDGKRQFIDLSHQKGRLHVALTDA